MSDFFDAQNVGVGRRETFEMFAMRKIDSAETRKVNNPSPASRFRRQVDAASTAYPLKGKEAGRDAGTLSPLRFHYILVRERNDNTTTKSLILAQDER